VFSKKSRSDVAGLSSKEDFRRHFRREMSLAFQESQNRALIDHLVSFLEQRRSEKIGAYSCLPGEPNLFELFQRLPKRQFAFPVAVDQDLQFRYCDPLTGSHWQVGQWGQSEPKQDCSAAVMPSELDAVLVPGVAFDRKGVRLGRGRGFYDRVLTSAKFKIGVHFSSCLVERLPSEAHDIKMDAVVTDDEILLIGPERN